ncbi:MAG: hypothetical protein ABI318_00475 [Chthoniobacteraceae bacterium]
MKQFALHSSAAIGFLPLSGQEVLNGAVKFLQPDSCSRRECHRDGHGRLARPTRTVLMTALFANWGEPDKGDDDAPQ